MLYSLISQPGAQGLQAEYLQADRHLPFYERCSPPVRHTRTNQKLPLRSAPSTEPMPAGAVQMAVPGHHTPRDIPYTPSAFSVASTGAAAFQTWLEEEEEEWRLAQRLEANCPKEFVCPISLDIMSDPVILVRPYSHAICPQDATYQSAARIGLHKYSGLLHLAFDNAVQAQIWYQLSGSQYAATPTC